MCRRVPMPISELSCQACCGCSSSKVPIPAVTQATGRTAPTSRTTSSSVCRTRAVSSPSPLRWCWSTCWAASRCVPPHYTLDPCLTESSPLRELTCASLPCTTSRVVSGRVCGNRRILNHTVCSWPACLAPETHGDAQNPIDTVNLAFTGRCTQCQSMT